MEFNQAFWLILAILWTLPWKGWALWKSARNKQNIWFMVLLVVNTLAILEIVYIFFFQKKKK
jgi:methionyl-tRNA synthetase